MAMAMAMEGEAGAGAAAAEGLFQRASREFEDSEGDGESLYSAEDGLLQHKELKTSGGATAAPPHLPSGVLQKMSQEDPPEPQNPVPAKGPPVGPSAAEVALATQDMERFMEQFGLDLEAVAQAFLKNSGEVAAVDSCLRMGQRSDGCPLWSRQDDADLLKGDKDLRNRLVARYGAENVDKREAFRKS
ncbi:hypothetical protein JD844_000699 [Phrynosoma platyrhinos]|uniref:Telomeric repeat-binding factor 2-interacting protein 1 n=1 Tax=Phrynosoma platyrhinos TaxID=52577 RepID=A0ABQ7SR06_PHRPL|nr:hypothetical protein JD844_000699 [Phrynosoma platyrhinos]